MEAVSTEFEKRNPGVKMHPLTVGGVILDKTIAAYAVGVPPGFGPIWRAPRRGGVLGAEITPLLAASSAINKDNYFDAQWDGTKWAWAQLGCAGQRGTGLAGN